MLDSYFRGNDGLVVGTLPTASVSSQISRVAGSMKVVWIAGPVLFVPECLPKRETLRLLPCSLPPGACRD